ncbi:hypothetical protein BIW11_04441 [Tropilaelaps mercedesae]|uniref:Uncharacterized protein n=1 Tax=Tropilaelaps mercedesae TaxID=418985 RepID=A0A1V9X6T7_9ACAR|nr:hypothetical protein BIW11_04441 [Tropilaelaps mercedesae]
MAENGVVLNRIQPVASLPEGSHTLGQFSPAQQRCRYERHLRALGTLLTRRRKCLSRGDPSGVVVRRADVSLDRLDDLELWHLHDVEADTAKPPETPMGQIGCDAVLNAPASSARLCSAKRVSIAATARGLYATQINAAAAARNQRFDGAPDMLFFCAVSGTSSSRPSLSITFFFHCLFTRVSSRSEYGKTGAIIQRVHSSTLQQRPQTHRKALLRHRLASDAEPTGKTGRKRPKSLKNSRAGAEVDARETNTAQTARRANVVSFRTVSDWTILKDFLVRFVSVRISHGLSQSQPTNCESTNSRYAMANKMTPTYLVRARLFHSGWHCPTAYIDAGTWRRVIDILSTVSMDHACSQRLEVARRRRRRANTDAWPTRTIYGPRMNRKCQMKCGRWPTKSNWWWWRPHELVRLNCIGCYDETSEQILSVEWLLFSVAGLLFGRPAASFFGRVANNSLHARASDIEPFRVLVLNDLRSLSGLERIAVSEDQPTIRVLPVSGGSSHSYLVSIFTGTALPNEFPGAVARPRTRRSSLQNLLIVECRVHHTRSNIHAFHLQVWRSRAATSDQTISLWPRLTATRDNRHLGAALPEDNNELSLSVVAEKNPPQKKWRHLAKEDVSTVALLPCSLRSCSLECS